MVVGNGASSALATQLFKDLGAEVNGINIHESCESTHPENLVQEVVKQEAHLGFAFNGDADRLIAVDHTGPSLMEITSCSLWGVI